jgi:acyl-CoA synthetase (NDP forming)
MHQPMRQERPAAQALDEYQSKQLLRSYGVPTVSEIRVATVQQIPQAVGQTGFPVVLKALGATLLHKTERDLVRLNLNDIPAVINAAEQMAAGCGEALEGFLIQPQILGHREFVAGLIRDPHFGPTVMFGLGGIFTEAISDVTFRVAPLTETDARMMLKELKAQNLLGAFRGEAAVNQEQLVQTLCGLSRLGVDHPEISEVDINPLIVTASGHLCAVDALVVKAPAAPPVPSLPCIDSARLRQFFYPQSIALVGASTFYRKWGGRLLCNIIGGGFRGDFYMVNPKGGDIYGRKAYRTIQEIPGGVDLGIVTIPAKHVLELVPQFQKKGIRNMLVISSGFGETGQQGQTLEAGLIEAATDADILILGPNTMGICNPHVSFFAMGSPSNPRPGGAAVVAQSGNMGAQLLAFAEQENIGIRLFAGSGNEAMITIEDYLNAFADDNLTRTVILYIEGFRDGRRFLETAQRVSRKKPVILLKGGRSSIGSQAAASHTGSLSSDNHIFNAVCRQAGVVTVTCPMDLLDTAAAFASLPLPQGNRVVVMTLGGGWGVVTADLCADYGLELVELPDELIERFNQLLPAYWNKANPVDIVGEITSDLPSIIMEELTQWQGCDAVINLGIMGRKHSVKGLLASLSKIDPELSASMRAKMEDELDKSEEMYANHLVGLMEKHRKPILGVSLMKGPEDQTLHDVAGSAYKAVFFKTPEQAVKALAKMWEYQQYLAG